MKSWLFKDSETKTLSARTARPRGSSRSTHALAVAALGLLAALPACSSDNGGGGNAADGGGANGGGANGGGGDAANGGGGGSEFQACVADLPVCKIAEKDTAEKIQQPCGATEFLPIPLTDGTTYGPATIEAGPQGAKIDWNQGAGTEFVNPINDSENTCDTVIAGFGEPTVLSDDIKNKRGMDLSLYTIFRPACMRDGETYPVITWANGTCGYTHGYATLLGAVASYGYVVIAANSTWTGTPPTNNVQVRAIDYAEAINEDPDSPLYQRLDLDHIGAMGHSQGAAATVTTGADPRVDAIIPWNQGASSDKPFLDVSGDRDIGMPTVDSLRSATEAATQPGAWVFFHKVLETGGNFTGHLVLMEQPERVWEMTVAWWDWQLKGKDEGKAYFVGDDCKLCNRDADFEYGHNTLLQ